ncbi:hypothetical protein RP20_CCG003089 [Aedes albopictus]|nr:hypothetical protein RP20_CCG003089 [Aedes albopictus]
MVVYLTQVCKLYPQPAATHTAQQQQQQQRARPNIVVVHCIVIVALCVTRFVRVSSSLIVCIRDDDALHTSKKVSGIADRIGWMDERCRRRRLMKSPSVKPPFRVKSSQSRTGI